MLTALRSYPLLRRLWLASTISLVGDWLSFVAVSLLALDHGGGPIALAGVLAVHALPRALLAPLAGAVADRFDRRRLLVSAAFAQAALTVLMALAAWRAEVALVQALVLVRGAVGAFVIFPLTARAPLLVLVALVWGMGAGSNWVLASAALQRLSPDRYIGRLASLDDLAWTVARIAGALCGALIAEATGSIASSAWLGVGLGLIGWALVMRGLDRPVEVIG